MIRIKILGCDGSPAPGRMPMSILINEHLVIDAGSVASALNVEERREVSDLVMSHVHLDHVRELGFLPAGRTATEDGPVTVWGTLRTLEFIRKCVFNQETWFDYSEGGSAALLKYAVISPHTPVHVAGVWLEAVPLTHTIETLGFIVGKGDCVVVLASDTGPTGDIWKRGKESGQVKAVFCDVSVPNRYAERAIKSGHLTPSLLATEMAKLAPHQPEVFAYHIKPEYYNEVVQELESQMPTVRVPRPGDVFEFSP